MKISCLYLLSVVLFGLCSYMNFLLKLLVPLCSNFVKSCKLNSPVYQVLCFQSFSFKILPYSVRLHPNGDSFGRLLEKPKSVSILSVVFVIAVHSFQPNCFQEVAILYFGVNDYGVCFFGSVADQVASANHACQSSKPCWCKLIP